MEFHFPVTASRKQHRKKINSNCISWQCFRSIRYSRKEKRIWKMEIDWSVWWKVRMNQNLNRERRREKLLSAHFALSLSTEGSGFGIDLSSTLKLLCVTLMCWFFIFIFCLLFCFLLKCSRETSKQSSCLAISGLMHLCALRAWVYVKWNEALAQV